MWHEERKKIHAGSETTNAELGIGFGTASVLTPEAATAPPNDTRELRTAAHRIHIHLIFDSLIPPADVDDARQCCVHIIHRQQRIAQNKREEVGIVADRDSMSSPPPVEDQARLLEDALTVVRQQTVLMRRCLETPGKLMDALKCRWGASSTCKHME